MTSEREEAIKQLKWYFEEDDGTGSDSSTKKAYEVALEALKEEPRKTARWIPLQDGYFFKRRPHKCSACGNILEFEGVNAGRGDANYCPNCGKRMMEEEQ